MIAPVASEPIGSSLSVGGERPRLLEASMQRDGGSEAASPGDTEAAAPVETVPLEVDFAPGEAFAVALVAAKLKPQRPSTLEVAVHFARAWSPPASELRLTDRKA